MPPRLIVLSLFLCFLFLFTLYFRLSPHLSLAPAPSCLLSLSLLFLPCFLPSPPLFLNPPHSALLISLPQHPVPSLWCVLVLATARPGRTDGYLLRQRSPWAPTPFPPPGAAQVSRWKVRGAGRGRRSWLKAWAGSAALWRSGQAARRESAFKAVISGCPG